MTGGVKRFSGFFFVTAFNLKIAYKPAVQIPAHSRFVWLCLFIKSHVVGPHPVSTTPGLGKQEYFPHSSTWLPSPCIVRGTLGAHLHLLLFFLNELLLVKWRWVGRYLQKTRESNTPNPFPLWSYDICAGLEASPRGFENLLLMKEARSSLNLDVWKTVLQGSDGTFESGCCS